MHLRCLFGTSCSSASQRPHIAGSGCTRVPSPCLKQAPPKTLSDGDVFWRCSEHLYEEKGLWSSSWFEKHASAAEELGGLEPATGASRSQRFKVQTTRPQGSNWPNASKHPSQAHWQAHPLGETPKTSAEGVDFNRKRVAMLWQAFLSNHCVIAMGGTPEHKLVICTTGGLSCCLQLDCPCNRESMDLGG